MRINNRTEIYRAAAEWADKAYPAYSPSKRKELAHAVLSILEGKASVESVRVHAALWASTCPNLHELGYVRIQTERGTRTRQIRRGCPNWAEKCKESNYALANLYRFAAPIVFGQLNSNAGLWRLFKEVWQDVDCTSTDNVHPEEAALLCLPEATLEPVLESEHAAPLISHD